MSFKLAKYIEPDFTQERFVHAPDCKLVTAPHAMAAPKGFHATSIFPEYFKINGKWHLAEDSRMDSVPVWDGEKVRVVEFRNIKEGDQVVVGREEDCSEGIYVHDNCWIREGEEKTELVWECQDDVCGVAETSDGTEMRFEFYRVEDAAPEEDILWMRLVKDGKIIWFY